MNTSKHILILGAGPAGLSAAYYAHKAGLSFQVIEATGEIGGNARTIEKDGFKFDTGAHRIHDKIPSITSDIKSILNGEVHQVDRPSKIMVNGKFISFPLNFLNLLSQLGFGKSLKYTWSFLRRQKTTNGSFKSQAESNYGKLLARDFLLNYTQKLWGTPTENLSDEISGNRTSGFSIWELFKRKGRHLEGNFYYPKKGIGQLFTKMARPFTERILTNHRVQKIISKKGGYDVITEHDTFEGTHIINTLPLTKMEAISGLPLGLDAIGFQPLNLLFITLNKNSITPFASLYFSDLNTPFTRIVEPKNRSAYMSPEKKTSLCVELPEAFEPNKILSLLIDMGLFTRQDVLSNEQFHLPNAYPKITLDQQQNVENALKKLDSLPDFVLLGRNANFKYLHIHQLMDEAKKIISDWIT